MVPTDFETINRQWPILFTLCEDEARFAGSNPEISAWDVAMQAGHIALAAESLAAIVEKLLAAPEKGAGKGPNEMGVHVLKSGVIPRGAGKVPDGLTWEGDCTPAAVRTRLASAQARWDGLASRIADIEKAESTFPHYAFGPLTPADWTRFCAMHTAHHLAIIRDILGESNWAAEGLASARD